jgi:hypothetical protein
MLALVILSAAAIQPISSLSEEKPASGEVARKENALPSEVRKILDKADRFVLLSLDPKLSEHQQDKPSDKFFHGYRVRRKIEIRTQKARDELSGALYEGIADWDGDIAMCFNPRHGIRANVGDETVDLVICFQCMSIQVYGKTDGEVFTTGSPAITFNRALGIAMPTDKPSPRKGIVGVALVLAALATVFIFFKVTRKMRMKDLSFPARA